LTQCDCATNPTIYWETRTSAIYNMEGCNSKRNIGSNPN
jgi:hypothetical protein